MKPKKLFAGYYVLESWRGKWDIVSKTAHYVTDKAGSKGRTIWVLYEDHGAYKSEVAKFHTLKSAVAHVVRCKLGR